MDFYDCIFKINDENRIDLTLRSRNINVESKCSFATDYLSSILNKLSKLEFDMNKNIVVIDDLCLGKVEIPYALVALLAQANSYTIYHYAIISYIVDRLGILIEDADFGYNPTIAKTTLN